MDEQLEKKWNAQIEGVRRSIRYHQRRQRFFERLNYATPIHSTNFPFDF